MSARREKTTKTHNAIRCVCSCKDAAAKKGLNSSLPVYDVVDYNPCCSMFCHHGFPYLGLHQRPNGVMRNRATESVSGEFDMNCLDFYQAKPGPST